ncbi:MAG: anti-virulence regulator CigR family protein [Plesiomonas shigelloides]
MTPSLKHRSFSRALLASALICSLSVTSVWADPPRCKGHGKDHSHHGHKSKHHKSKHKSDFSTTDALIAAGITVAAARSLALNNQLIQFSPLPPGIQKNLMRGKPLPPGIAKKMLPVPFIKQLPHHPGYEWRAVGSDLVLVALSTAIVVDVLKNVFD